MSVGRGNLLAFTDAAITTKSVIASLEDNGFVVETTSRQECLLPAIKAFDPELILVPVFLEGYDTQQLLDNIVSEQSHPPVLLLGNADQVSLVGPMMQAGAEEYFLGTTEETDLLFHLIDKTIQTHRTMIALEEREANLKSELEIVISDQSAGFDVQQKLLPDSPLTIGKLTFSYLLKPSQGMSGDSVNCIQLPDGRVLFYLADVSGHGAPGGLVTTALTLMSHRLVSGEMDLSGKSSGEILGWFNQELLLLHLDQHITMFLGLIDEAQNKLEYSSAAHFPATILKQSGETKYLELGGLPLGVCETEYESWRLKLASEFEIVSFSDGVLEILPQEALKDRESHLLSLVESAPCDIDVLAKSLDLDSKGGILDDIAVLTFTRMS